MPRSFTRLLAALLTTGTLWAATPSAAPKEASKAMTQSPAPATIKTATFGQGCYWCAEAVFQKLEGVLKSESGFAGGHVDNPTYQQVCQGTTGHAEVIHVTYDPSKIRYDDLLEVFFKTHDPTTLNRQGNDVGSQYRSAIFYHDPEQKQLAEHYIKKLDEAKAYPSSIVTELAPFKTFYKAEDYHQNYFKQNPGQGYCQFVIQPKVEKFREVFHGKLKKGE